MRRGRPGPGGPLRALSIPDRYLELAFRLAKHEPELVESYVGPLERAAAVEAEEPLPPARLVEDARSLLADLGRDDLEPQRSAWLAGETRALLTVALRLDGESFAYADEVEGLYGIRPRWYDERHFEEADALLAAALPGEGDVRARFARWYEQTAVPTNKLLPALQSVTAELRARTEELVGLPAGEAFEIELVSGERWFGFNRTLGGLRSRISINTDLPLPAGELAYLMAHEGYPGHHADGVWKEHVFVRGRGELEETMTLVVGSQATMAEGVAELAIDMVSDDGGQELSARHLRELGFDFDAALGAKVFAARRLLRQVLSNVALLLFERSASLEEGLEYARRWSLQPEERVEKMVAAVHGRRFPGYVHCYPEGLRLADAFVRGDSARFKRLLVEHLVPADLAA